MMDKVFITMQDLSSEANVVYASDSISDVLGYAPHEVVGKSTFDYFHPDEVAAARKIHRRGVQQDKAAMLIYCNIRRKDGEYAFCECIFSMVYDVFVTAITIHSNSSKSEGRALTAPVIRHVFSSSPSDPRYHMLTHLSSKFQARPRGSHEPRAALILNRFTRSLTILYASHALADILDLPPNEAIGKSFYECISEHCLQDAVEALERAKENDSIAYLRFQWRDPLLVNRMRSRIRPKLAQRRSTKRKRASVDDSENGRVAKKPAATKSGKNVQSSHNTPDTSTGSNGSSNENKYVGVVPGDTNRIIPDGFTGFDGFDNDIENEEHADFDGIISGTSDEGAGVRDVEAVVSSTSDGLVVILRLARPMIPKPLYGSGKSIFASPWANNPLGAAPTASVNSSDLAESSLMETIQQVAVFAWSLNQLGGEVVLSDDKETGNSSSKLPHQPKETEESLLSNPTSVSVPLAAEGRSSTGSSGSGSGSGSSGNDDTNEDTPATSVSRNTSASGNTATPPEQDGKAKKRSSDDEKSKEVGNKTMVVPNGEQSKSTGKKGKAKEAVPDLNRVDEQLEHDPTAKT